MCSMPPTKFTAFGCLEGMLAGTVESHFKCIQHPPHWWLTKCGGTLPILEKGHKVVGDAFAALFLW